MLNVTQKGYLLHKLLPLFVRQNRSNKKEKKMSEILKHPVMQIKQIFTTSFILLCEMQKNVFGISHKDYLFTSGICIDDEDFGRSKEM